MKPMKSNRLNWVLPVLLFVPLAFSSPASNEASVRAIPIKTWLVLGPMPVHLPLFHDAEDVQGETVDLEKLLKFDQTDVKTWWPIDGKSVLWQSFELRWTQVETDSTGLTLYSGSEENSEILYMAAYIDAHRFTKAKLRVTGYHLFSTYLDGKMIIQKSKADTPETEGVQKAKELFLEPGKHLLLIKTLRDPKSDASWTVDVEIDVPEMWTDEELIVTCFPDERMTVEHMMDGPKVTDVSLSPDGLTAAVSFRQVNQSDEKSESWIELRQIRDGSLERSYRGLTGLSRIQWAPTGKKFSYVRSGKEMKTIWVVNVDDGSHQPVLEDVKHLGQHTWAPDGSFIVYSIVQKPKAEDDVLKRLRGMPDRWPTWRERSTLYSVSIPSGIRQRLTAGGMSTDLGDIRPDGQKLIFSRSSVDFTERPYSKATYYVLDLTSMELDTLFTTAWTGSARWSPDGQKILFTGGPEMFGDLGVNVRAGQISNGYDTQAYIWDVATGEVDPITREFDPAVNSVLWSHYDGHIYLTATDKSYRRLFRYDTRSGKFENIETQVDVIGRFDIASKRPVAVYTGSGTSKPSRAYSVDLRKLRKQSVRVLADPARTDYRHVKFGDIQDWNFMNERDREITGRIYTPPDFDPSRKYPCIVYYYGGTSPVSRDFGGRYPKEIWAAHGYVVYVLQPSGATGFGQEFSALHVNDWGIIVADEIIDGVQRFLRTHPFIDEKRVGCIGASYGGFMTMLLTTRTDLFSAAVAHAGISSISSYWGEGFWGYLYSATATANSFPWNRKDIYIDQSPLFSADRVNTPLLLTHGTVDTNVPPGESIQLYTALKLLGKETELIFVEDQNHHILAYQKRIAWTKTLIAWFDRWLKDQPEWWDQLYPEE